MRGLISFVFLCSASVAVAQTDSSTKPKSPDVNRQMTITYGSPSWNTDSTKIDTAFVLLRDKASGKIVHIQLEETEPDSSEFTGTFSVSIGDTERISPEIYIPPQEQRGQKDYKKLYDAIQSGKLQRKPVLLKQSERGQAIIDVYDTREQATEALAAYQEKQKLTLQQKAPPVAAAKPTVNDAAIAAAKAAADHKALLEKMAMESANRETQRIRMEQIERQKAEEAARLAKLMTEAEREKRRTEASALATEADKLYEAGDFTGAEPKYRRASELDADNTSYYMKYGVSLYRNGKFNDALVALKLAKLEGQRDLERKYFTGLAHYRLGELDPAIKTFSEIAATKDPSLAPSALFYMGVVQYSKESYEEAKKAFETVIDTSSDPKMDAQAEEYLDKVAAQLAYKKMRENKFIASGMIGLSYDSNVLLSPDNSTDQGAGTNISDARLLTVAEMDYRPIFNEHHEWSANASANLTNSAKTAAAKADPFLYDLALPYTYKGLLFKKGYRLTAKPGYEVLFMDPTGTGTKTNILSSNILGIDNTLIMSDKWFSTYSLEYRMDDSKTADSVGPADADASKYSLRTAQALFLDKGKKQIVMGNLGYVVNAAKGSNKKYNRTEFGATYLRPIAWGSTFNFNLAVFQLSYPTADTIVKI